MRKIEIALLCALLFTTAQGISETVHRQGPCPGGGTWIMVIVYGETSGLPMRMEGTNCAGIHWVWQCGVMPAMDGGAGVSDIYEVNGDMWIRANVDPQGVVTEAWGKDLNGNYWTAIPNESSPVIFE
jgi:hypothetical protein